MIMIVPRYKTKLTIVPMFIQCTILSSDTHIDLVNSACSVLNSFYNIQFVKLFSGSRDHSYWCLL